MRCELCPANRTTIRKSHRAISSFTCSAVAIAVGLDVDIVVTLMEQIPAFIADHFNTELTDYVRQTHLTFAVKKKKQHVLADHVAIAASQ